VPNGSYRLSATETLRVHGGERISGISLYAKRRGWPAGSTLQVSIDPGPATRTVALVSSSSQLTTAGRVHPIR
jgi:hypothetical protein